MRDEEVYMRLGEIQAAKEYREPPTQMNDQTQKTLSERLDQIESRANAATPGPWRADDKSAHFAVAIRPGTTGFLIASIGRDNMLYRGDKARQVEPDANFIAAARSDVPALVKALNRVIDYVRADLPKVRADLIESDIAQLLREPADSKNDL